MKVSCPSCRTQYSIDDKRIPDSGARLKCAKCQTSFPVKAEPAAKHSEPPPLPASPPPLPTPQPVPIEPAPFEMDDGPIPLPAPPSEPEPPSEPDPFADFTLDDSIPAVAANATEAAAVPLPPPDPTQNPFEGFDADPPKPVVPDLASDFGDVEFSDSPESSPVEFESALPPPPIAPAASSGLYVRRRNGKVLQPLEAKAIVRQLEAGELTGTEEISNDQIAWTPIGADPRFAAALERADAALQHSKTAKIDEAKTSPLNWFRRHLVVAIGIVFLAATGAMGLSLGATRYGIFGLNRLFPSKIAENSEAFAQLQAARRALLLGTFLGYQDAETTTEKILQTKEYPEARALWCQAVFYLERRYHSAKLLVPQALQFLPRVELLGSHHPEVVKALAGEALLQNQADKALSMIQAALLRPANQEDNELTFLREEALEIKSDRPSALEILHSLVKFHPDSSRAWHTMGNLLQTMGKLEPAAQAYAMALKADPQHLISTIELSSVELREGKGDADIEVALNAALRPDNRQTLAPVEQGKALTARGLLLSRQFKYLDAQVALDEAQKLDPSSASTLAALGNLHLLQRQYAEALPLFRQAVNLQPREMEYTEGYLRALIGAGNMGDALTAVARAEGQFPGNARIAFLEGRVNDGMDDLAGAEAHYKSALITDEKYIEPRLALASLYLRQRRFPDAKREIEKAVKQSPEDPQVQVAEGDYALSQNDLETSSKAYQHALQVDDRSSMAHLGLARVAFEKAEYEASKKQVTEALSLEDPLAGANQLLGRVFWKLHALTEAIGELEKAKGLDPKNAAIAVSLGAIHFEKNEMAEAEKDLSSALSLNVSDPEAYFYMGRVKDAQTEYTQAIDNLKSAIERAPKVALYLYHLGLTYRNAKKMPEALEAWNRALKLDPAYTDVLEALGQAYFDLGNVSDALSHFERGLTADPTRYRMVGLLGDCYAQMGRWVKAGSLYQQALRADPSLVSLYFKVGHALTQQGHHGQAIAWYQQAIEKDAKNPLPYRYLGFALKEKGKKTEASAAFKKYLEKDPQADDKKDIQDEIYDLDQAL